MIQKASSLRMPGPPLQQRGRQTGGNLRRHFFFERRISTQNRAGILPDKKRSIDFPARRFAVRVGELSRREASISVSVEGRFQF